MLLNWRLSSYCELRKDFLQCALGVPKAYHHKLGVIHGLGQSHRNESWKGTSETAVQNQPRGGEEAQNDTKF